MENKNNPMVKGFHIIAPTCHHDSWALKCCLKACTHHSNPLNTNTTCWGLRRTRFLAVCLLTSGKCRSSPIRRVVSTKRLNCTVLPTSPLGADFSLKLSESHGSVIPQGTTLATRLVWRSFHEAPEKLQAAVKTQEVTHTRTQAES